jgi:hypothetical protein
METETFILFCKRDNSVKNQRTISKFALDLRIPMTYLHMQFEPYTCIQAKVRERKLNSSSRRITLSKNQWTKTKFEIDLRISMTHLHVQFEPYIFTAKEKLQSEN